MHWQRLQDELMPFMTGNTNGRLNISELSTLPFLNAVLKEGLRISCPIRGHMPRVVPNSGWTYRSFHFPVGVSISRPSIHNVT